MQEPLTDEIMSVQESHLLLTTMKPETFDLLGCTNYWSKSRNGKFRVKHRAAGKKCKQMNITIKDMRFEKEEIYSVKG